MWSSAPRRGGHASQRQTWLLVALVTVVGLAVTGAAASWVRGLQAQRAAEAERVARDRATAVIDRRIDSYVAVLHDLRGFVTANGDVTRELFSDYVQAADIHRRYPGVQALQLTRVVAAGDVAAFERRVRAEGFPDFTVHPASRARTRYVIDYVEPLIGNEPAFGLDLSATPERLRTVTHARDRGETIASTGITLVQTGERGFLLLQPIYARGVTPRTLEGRRAAFRGLVNGVFRLDDVLAGVLPREIAGEVEIYDGGAVEDPVVPHSEESLLFDSNDELAAPADVANASDLGHIVVGGRRWLVFVRAGTDAETWLPWALAGGGALLTAALATLVLSLSRSRARAEVLVARRTQDLAERADELRDARDQAQAANRAKSEFLSNMSHELRTPLNGILGTYELLDSPQLDDDTRRRYLQLGHRAANELLAIVNDILDLSRIEAGRVDLACEPFALPALVGDVTARMQVLAGDKDLGVTADVAPGVPQQVVGDPLRLRQVLTNLIANGIKFTDTGSVSLTVDRHDEGLVHFAVADTGIGIDQRDQERIFGSFEQADVSSTRRFGGTGLGLAIVTRLVRLMGGTIWLDSSPGVGSTFHFTADLPADDMTRRGPQRGAPDPDSGVATVR